MKLNTLFPAKYATGSDLLKPANLTIARVVMEDMHPAPGAPAVSKPVIYFSGATKGIILTRPLAYQIAEIHGDDTDQWTGKRIQLYSQPMNVAGQQRQAVRARRADHAGVNQPAPATLQQEEEEEI